MPLPRTRRTTKRGGGASHPLWTPKEVEWIINEQIRLMIEYGRQSQREGEGRDTDARMTALRDERGHLRLWRDGDRVVDHVSERDWATIKNDQRSTAHRLERYQEMLEFWKQNGMYDGGTVLRTDALREELGDEPTDPRDVPADRAGTKSTR